MTADKPTRAPDLTHIPSMHVDKATEDDLDSWFVEDICRFATRDGRHVIDVGWYQEGDRNGHFRCAVLDSNYSWQYSFTTRDNSEVRQWIAEILAKEQ